MAAATAERLAGNLQDFPRYGMVLRGSAEDLLGEPPAGEASTETAADLGRRAGADAVVTGNVAVGNQRGRLELDVQFALVAAADGRVVDSWGYKTRYEPAPQGPRGAERSVTLAELIRQGPSGDLARPSAAPTAGEVLPREAAAAYAPRITPHWSVLRIPLAGGGGQFGDAARTAAAGGRGLEALLNFRRSAVRDPRDPGAWYNIAVMYESLGQWPHAQEAYRKAVDIYETAAFRRGLQRVERELARQAEAPVPGG
jgi:tetratricopeptide (TPR) repeat protein